MASSRDGLLVATQPCAELDILCHADIDSTYRYAIATIGNAVSQFLLSTSHGYVARAIKNLGAVWHIFLSLSGWKCDLLLERGATIVGTISVYLVIVLMSAAIRTFARLPGPGL